MEYRKADRGVGAGEASMSLRVLSILHDSVVDGEGLRTVIFFSGCPHQCKGCHNPQSWNMMNGTEMTVEEVAAEVLSNPLTDVTLSGGEPFMQAKEVSELARLLRQSGRHIWSYTGYTIEQLMEHGTPDQKELLHSIDVLVDGPFIAERRCPGLPFRGSDNQRIWRIEDGTPVGLIFP
ncbi:anaerobic ribonucleoside-triphosphate reductase activating protein [Paenibacillus alvei]|uniref:anaerobic ribonucleoside-triphosphate reductase activating protein n=1 Tax=Paenibacillus alvei TaxID=44250 RepID=UPI001F50A652|nr:anaerobic ribonucleoside-triphosphate reductase activating protein [Paenibacillus alvei]MCY9579025.1 anaerobic ribonucleoside-triphosphate reductase activating protein [Paenibacillus alvei]MCY9583453.1 anaerobic ribonucleoside-triphosphate reductase activating protein [Paenibacillus alvei]